MLRNSERQTFKRCRHRWQWTYLDGRQSIEAPNALRFGDLVHRALAPYFKPGRKRGPHPARTFEKLYVEQAAELRQRGFDVYSDEKWVDALDLGTGMLNGYVERFAAADAEYEVVASEQTFQLRVSTLPFIIHPGDDPSELSFWVVGTFDGVWRHLSSKKVVFKEFKTAASIQYDGLPMDEQAGTYWTYGPKWLLKKGILQPGEMPSEILYTFLRKATPPVDRPKNAEGHYLNKDGSVSKSQPSPFFGRVPVYRDQPDRERMHERVCAEMIDIYRAREGSVLSALYKNPGPLHMPNCRGCGVREACEVHESGGDWRSVLESTHTAWNAYAAHELAERH